MPLNRVVALFTPIFSAAGAVGSAWLLKHFPGVPTPSSAELTGAMVTGASAAAGAALMWLKGHQAWEARLLSYAKPVEAAVSRLDPALPGEIEALIKSEIAKLAQVIHPQPQPQPTVVIHAAPVQAAPVEAPPVSTIPPAPPATGAQS